GRNVSDLAAFGELADRIDRQPRRNRADEAQRLFESPADRGDGLAMSVGYVSRAFEFPVEFDDHIDVSVGVDDGVGCGAGGALDSELTVIGLRAQIDFVQKIWGEFTAPRVRVVGRHLSANGGRVYGKRLCTRISWEQHA